MSSLLLYCAAAAALLAAILLAYPCGFTTRLRALLLLMASLALVAVVLWWPSPGARVARGKRLVDAALPRYQFAERHRTKICASPERIATAFRQVQPGDIHGLALLSMLRGLASPADAEDRPMLDLALDSNFILLADTPGEMVLATAGEFWRSRGAFAAGDPVGVTLGSLRGNLAGFAAADFGGAPKAVFNFTFDAADFGCQAVATETRIYAGSPEMQRRFALYWRVIQPGSALLRRTWLDAIRRRAEAQVP